MGPLYAYRRTHKQAHLFPLHTTDSCLTACGQIALTIYPLDHLWEMCALPPPTHCAKTSCYFSYLWCITQIYSKYKVINTHSFSSLLVLDTMRLSSAGQNAEKNIKNILLRLHHWHRQVNKLHTQYISLFFFFLSFHDLHLISVHYLKGGKKRIADT